MEGTQSLDMAGAALENYDPIVAAMGLLAEAHVPPPYAVALHPGRLLAGPLRAVGAVAGETRPELVQLNAPLPRPEGLPPFWATGQLHRSASENRLSCVYAPAMLLCVRRRDVTVEIDRSEEFSSDAVKVRARRGLVSGPQ